MDAFARTLGAFTGGYGEGQQVKYLRDQQELERQRQASLDQERVREYNQTSGLARAAQSLTAAKTLDMMGAVPDTGTPVASDFDGTMRPGSVFSGGGALNAAAQALTAGQNARRFQIADPAGGVQSYRIDESQTPEAHTAALERAKQGEMGDRMKAVDAQKAGEARDAKELVNRQYYADLQAANPNHPLVKTPYAPPQAANYKGAFDAEVRKQELDAKIKAAAAGREAAPKGSYQQDKDGNFIWLPAGGGTPFN